MTRHRSCRLHEDKEREVILQFVRHTQSEIVNAFGCDLKLAFFLVKTDANPSAMIWARLPLATVSAAVSAAAVAWVAAGAVFVVAAALIYTDFSNKF